jgi:hypothetical protein
MQLETHTTPCRLTMRLPRMHGSKSTDAYTTILRCCGSYSVASVAMKREATAFIERATR